MATILDAAAVVIIPFIVRGAFAGLRAAEITRSDLSAIDLERRFVTIRASQAKTASRRGVPISYNLKAWLLPHVGRGLACPQRTNLPQGGQSCGIEWPHNVVNHSFISYRIAKTKNAIEAALEAGNSPEIIFRHYREMATEEQAAAWSAIVPKAE